jgi:hypothetical protein
MKKQEIVKKILNSKVVDFAAIGKVVNEIGPSLALSDEPWEGFCGTMRHFVSVYQQYQYRFNYYHTEMVKGPYGKETLAETLLGVIE